MIGAERRNARGSLGARGTMAAAVGLAVLVTAGCEPADTPGAGEAGDTVAMDTAAAMDTMAADTALADTVEVRLTELTIEMPGTLSAGPTVFHVTNDGTVEHNFEVEGQGIEEELAQNLAPGDSGTLRVDLEPGTYEIYCPVADHADRGMRMDLTVEESSG